MLGNTIIAAPFEASAPMRAFLVEDSSCEWLRDSDVGQRLFKIRAADTEGHRSSASILVNRRYAWRGYRSTSAPAPKEDERDRITLVAVGKGDERD